MRENKPESASMSGQLKILVVDDAAENLTLVEKVVSNMGHVAIPARTGVEAIEKFKSESPDMVLMDIMMPEMDGYEAASRIKALSDKKWVPVIFLSALAQDTNLVQGLEAGGDDYLTKPINLVVLQAKIKAMQRIAGLQSQLAEKAGELERYYHQAEEERRISSHIMRHLVNAKGLADELLQYWVAPAHYFSGDVVAAARTPGGVLHVMLADGIGHGLSAALNVMPLTQIFYSMVDKGFSVWSIAAELNAKIGSLLPADRFVAATLVSVDARNGVIEIWNGGNPPLLFLDDKGRIVRSWESRHLPLGILKEKAFDSHVETFKYDQPGQLFMCSDGLIEAENREGEVLGWERVTAVISAAYPEQRFIRLLNTLNAHLQGKTAHDDISLALVRVPDIAPGPSPSSARVLTSAPAGHEQWKLEISLGADEIKNLDIVPLLMGILEKIDYLKDHIRPVFLIVSELFSNALDHGLLRLDSGIKSLPGGFDQYVRLREERLAALEQGCITLGFGLAEKNGRQALRIRVKDSGEGFNFCSVVGADMEANSKFFGRGLSLVRELGSGIEFQDCGNEVAVYYDL